MCLSLLEKIYQMLKQIIESEKIVCLSVTVGESYISMFTSIEEVALNNDYITIVLSSETIFNEYSIQLYNNDILDVSINSEEDFTFKLKHCTISIEVQDDEL